VRGSSSRSNIPCPSSIAAFVWAAVTGSTSSSEDLVVVEIKAVAEISPIHVAQVLTYLKLTGYPLALLMNFNVSRLIKGTRRLINRERAERFRL
jgi:hypothetical protein